MVPRLTIVDMYIHYTYFYGTDLKALFPTLDCVSCVSVTQTLLLMANGVSPDISCLRIFN